MLYSQLWIPQGIDISGWNNDRMGTSVDLNNAGDRIVIGFPESTNGHVKVYEWNGASWNQLGSNIMGANSNDDFGFSVSMNASGDIIAVGDPNYLTNPNNTYSYSNGSVSIYAWNGTDWNQLGSTIEGGLYSYMEFGYSVCLNSAGDRLAIGAPGRITGYVRIFDWNGTSWIQNSVDILGESEDDEAGISVSLNGLGDRLAIGSPNAGKGMVRFYEYRFVNYSEFYAANKVDFTHNPGDPPIIIGASNGWNSNPNHYYWIQLGSDLNSPSTLSGSPNTHENFGCSVSFNDAGDRLAIGDAYDLQQKGVSYVFRLLSGDWQQLGNSIIGDDTYYKCGSSVSLNSTGDRLAIGCPLSDVNGTYSGHVEVYNLNGSTWAQAGSDIYGDASGDQCGTSVSLNAIGDWVAVGAPKHGSGGNVRIYGFDQGNGCAVNTYVSNNSPLLSVGPITNASYQWLDCNNSNAIIVGETSHQLNASANGDYAVEVTYSNGCIDTSACYQVTNVVTYDTITILDTVQVIINDTIVTDVIDTIIDSISVYDTTYVQINDTVIIYDTSIVTISDTLIDTLIYNDTVMVNVTDTTIYYDTVITNVNDTIIDTLNVFDTSYVSISVTDTLYIDILITGVNNVSNTIKVYPNPASDIVIIDNGNYSAMSNYTLRITNALAQQVFNASISIPQFQIPVSTLGSVGTYFIQIFDSTNNLVETKQLILH